MSPYLVSSLSEYLPVIAKKTVIALKQLPKLLVGGIIFVDDVD